MTVSAAMSGKTMWRQRDTQPDDVVEGVDPAVEAHATSDRIAVYRCDGCDARLPGWGAAQRHLAFGHPAVRNPDVTCHAAPPWDQERWCIRAKGHDGAHWTPAHGGGLEWENRS